MTNYIILLGLAVVFVTGNCLIAWMVMKAYERGATAGARLAGYQEAVFIKDEDVVADEGIPEETY